MHINVNSLGDRKKLSKVLDYAAILNKDFMAFSDTRTSTEYEHIIKAKTKHRAFFNHGTSNSKGILLLVNQNLADLTIEHTIIVQGQLSKFSFEIDRKKYNLIVLYGPSESDNHDFFRQYLFNYNILPATEHNIIVGDFNATQDQYLDCRNYMTNTTPKTSK